MCIIGAGTRRCENCEANIRKQSTGIAVVRSGADTNAPLPRAGDVFLGLAILSFYLSVFTMLVRSWLLALGSWHLALGSWHFVPPESSLPFSLFPR